MVSDAALRRVLPKSTVDLVGDLVRGLLWGTAGVVWLSFLQVYARLWRLALTDPESDFTIFYYTARLVADGQPMYGASPARYGIQWAGSHLGNLNPPHFQLLVQPLASLSYGQAYIVWTVASLIACGVAIVLILRALRVEMTRARAVVGGALIISSAPFTTVAVTSELTFLLMVPFTLAWIHARSGRWTAAGAWLGLCAGLKLFFLLFVPWLVWQRRWRALGACAFSIAASFAVGALVFGPPAYVEWLKWMRAVGWEWLPMNASWPGLVARLVRGSATIEPVWRAASLERGLALTGSALICLVSLAVAVRLRNTEERQDAAWLLLFVAAILASPLGWVYYLPLGLGPLLGLMGSGGWRLIPPRHLAVVCVAAVGFWVPQEAAASGQPSPLATVTLASAYFWALAALWIGTMTAGRRMAPA
jgi:hypothetical protein